LLNGCKGNAADLWADAEPIRQALGFDCVPFRELMEEIGTTGKLYGRTAVFSVSTQGFMLGRLDFIEQFGDWVDGYMMWHFENRLANGFVEQREDDQVGLLAYIPIFVRYLRAKSELPMIREQEAQLEAALPHQLRLLQQQLTYLTQTLQGRGRVRDPLPEESTSTASANAARSRPAQPARRQLPGSSCLGGTRLQPW
jgi:hypothetical protein